MNGPQHFSRAERYARLSDAAFRKASAASDLNSFRHMDSARWFQDQGRLHAELAMAAATAAAFGIAWEAEQREEAAQWSGALSPEPLVTCGARLGENSPESCELAIGHDGSHEADGPGGLICWSDARESEDQPEPNPDPGPVLCGCTHPETHHAGRLEDTAPRGVCLTGCGCLRYDPADETARSAS